MNRNTFLQTATLGTVGLTSFPLLKRYDAGPFEKLEISLTPWSLMRTGYGGDDPLGIDIFEYPRIAKSLGFDYIDHEMFHFPPDLNDKMIDQMLY